jgi:hypothetical protein
MSTKSYNSCEKENATNSHDNQLFIPFTPEMRIRKWQTSANMKDISDLSQFEQDMIHGIEIPEENAEIVVREMRIKRRKS